MKTTLDILIEARAIVASDRWTKTMLCDTRGKVCALGAIGRAIGWSDEHMIFKKDAETYDVLAVHPATTALSRAVPADHRKRAGGEEYWNVIDFNDDVNLVSEGDHEAHQKKVIALFDKAIADERARVQEQEAGAPLPPVEQPALAHSAPLERED